MRPLATSAPISETSARARRLRRLGSSVIVGGLILAGSLATPPPAGAQTLRYLSDLGLDTGTIIFGPANNTLLGNTRAEAAGDINGDGRADLIINLAEAASEGGYIVWGRTSFPQWLDLSVVSATNRTLFTVDAEAGDSVAGLGDINNDGLSDFGITDADSDGHAGLPQTNSGSVFVVFGSTTAFPASSDLNLLNGTNGFQLHGPSASDNLGLDRHSLAGVGDVNGDGFGDFVVTATYGDGPTGTRTSAGEAYLIFGRSGTWAAETDMSALTAGTQVVPIYGNEAQDQLARAAGVGDVNGDGLADILLAASLADGPANARTNGGEGYLVFGRTTWPTSLEVSALDGATGVTLLPADAQDRLGIGVSTAGDFNGDGLADVLISAELADGAGNTRSQASDSYVIFGRTSWTSTLELSALNGTTGFMIHGSEASDIAGFNVASAGDFNGDGFHDIVVGVPGGDAYLNSLSGAGEAFLLFGRSGVWPAAMDASTLNGINGFRYIGAEASDGAGFTVGPAADYNGDGVSDMIIVATNGDGDTGARTNAGDVHVVFGEATATVATYRARARSGNALPYWHARLENGAEWLPSSRIQFDFANGTGTGPSSSSLETVELHRTVNGLYNVSRQFSPPVHWRLSNDRTGDTQVTIRVYYTDGEAEGLNKANLRLYYSQSVNGPWTQPGQTPVPTRNYISTTLPANLYPLVVVLSTGSLTTVNPAPTATFNLPSGNPTANELVDFSIDFNQAVEMDASDVTLAGTLTGSATLFSFTGPAVGDVYTARVLLTNQTANGTIGISIPANVVLSDYQIPYAGGSSPLYTINNAGGPVNCADIDKNGTVNVADVTALANHVVNGTPLP